MADDECRQLSGRADIVECRRDAVLLFAHSLLSRIPTAALGGIVIFAAIELIDVTAFRRLLAFRRAELLIAVATFVGVLVFDILYGCWSRSACPWPTCCSG